MWRFCSGRTALGLLALAAGSFFATPLVAESMMRGGKGYFMIGWSQIDLGDLNRDLGSRGYERFDEDFLSLGGGGHFMIGRLVIGGQGHGYIGGDQDATVGGVNYRTDLHAGAGFFDLGFIAWEGERATLAPLVGLGAGGIMLEIRERSAPTFDDVLADPGRSSRLSSTAFLMDLGGQADFMLGSHRRGPGEGGFMLGLRVGYVIAPFVGEWRLEDNGISGGPEVGITGPYVRFLIGGGGRHEAYDD